MVIFKEKQKISLLDYLLEVEWFMSALQINLSELIMPHLFANLLVESNKTQKELDREFAKLKKTTETAFNQLEKGIIANIKKLDDVLQGGLAYEVLKVREANKVVTKLNELMTSVQGYKDEGYIFMDNVAKPLNGMVDNLNRKIAVYPKDPPNGKIPLVKKLK